MSVLGGLLLGAATKALSGSKSNGGNSSKQGGGTSGSYTPKGDYFDKSASLGDKALLAAYKEQWATADKAGDEAGKAAAHDAAEGIRAKYGYSGGEDGSEHLGMTQQQIDYNHRRQEQTLDAMRDELRGLYSGQDSAYAQAFAQQQAANRAAVQQAVNTLEGRKTEAERQYSDLFRQLYIDKMRNRRSLDQRLAAGGVTGGAAESTILGYDSAYEDALRQGEQGRIGTLGELDRAIADTRLTGDIKNAEAAAKAAREQTDAYADTLRDLVERQEKRIAQETSAQREDAATERAYAYKTAMQMIGGGILPSEALLARAGIDAASARAMVAESDAERAQREEKETARAAKPTLTAAQVLAALKNGLRTPEVLRAYEYYYGASYR